jgi:hypothetical protein
MKGILMSVPSSDSAAIRQIIRALIEAGYELDSVDNGGVIEPVISESEAIGEIFSVDSAWLFVKDSKGEDHGVFFVLGNSPEEVAADWNVSLDSVMDSVLDKWTS